MAKTPGRASLPGGASAPSPSSARIHAPGRMPGHPWPGGWPKGFRENSPGLPRGGGAAPRQPRSLPPPRPRGRASASRTRGVCTCPPTAGIPLGPARLSRRVSPRLRCRFRARLRRRKETARPQGAGGVLWTSSPLVASSAHPCACGIVPLKGLRSLRSLALDLSRSSLWSVAATSSSGRSPNCILSAASRIRHRARGSRFAGRLNDATASIRLASWFRYGLSFARRWWCVAPYTTSCCQSLPRDAASGSQGPRFNARLSPRSARHNFTPNLPH